MLFRDSVENYTTVPTRTVAGTISLIRALVVAAPTKAPTRIKARLVEVLTTGSALQAAWMEVHRPNQPAVNLRPHDLRLDRVWRKVHNRTQDWIDLEHSEDSERAAELFALLFPTGLDFLTFKYNEQWSESQRRLDIIAADELGAELDTFVGPTFMAELHEAHDNYGEVLGITVKREPSPDPARVIDALREAQQAVRSYARLVFAYADPNDDDEVATAEAALEPLLRFRTPRVVAEAEAEPVDEPLPVLDEGEDAGGISDDASES